MHERIRTISTSTSASDVGLSLRLKKSKAGQLYLVHVRRHAVIHNLTVRIWRNTYPWLARLGIPPTRSKTKWLGTTKASEFIQQYGGKKNALLCPIEIEAPRFRAYPKSDEEFLAPFLGRYVFPEISVYELDNATIEGGTNLALANEHLIHHDLYDFSQDFTSEELHGRAVHDPANNRARWLSLDQFPEYEPSCATFVDACAVNYAHWMTEVLPRIALFCGDKRFDNVPIVVNSDLHKNIMESLFEIAGPNREILTLPIGRAITAEKLYVTSVTGYVPFEPRYKNRTQRPTIRGQFSPYALGQVRAKLRTRRFNIKARWHSRIYIRRNSRIRRLTNNNKLEKLLTSRGFEIIEPERLSFQQQATLFMHADVVVGATGAALANTILCRPGTLLGILVAKNKFLAYEYWLNMLTPLGINISYIFGTGRTDAIHTDFEVDEAHLLEFLDTLDSQEMRVPREY